jgi:NAD(P)-dependent dehydrogenase (short-subunit alcohol dehydrogenase family)
VCPAPGETVQKAALRSYTRSFAAELAPRGIRVNAVSPGPIDTPIFGKTGLSREAVGQFADAIGAQVPLGRFGKPEEMASVVLFLASDESSHVNGAETCADLGFARA